MARLGSKDGLAALLFLALGLFVVAVGRTYEIGTPQRMGPGFFPVSVGCLLMVFGLAIGIAADAAPRPTWEVRGPVMVLVSVAAFALLLPMLGLFLTGIAVVVIAGLADPPIRPGELAKTAVGLTVLVTVLFVILLRMAIPIWPELW